MTAKPKGFSLIEVSMVLAISVVMMGVVAGVFNQRRNVANDDAAQQVASIVQTVQNEAKQGQGPSGANNIVAGETLWGNSIQFSNSCAPSSKPCFVVNKLVKDTATADIRSYETYQIVTPENFEFSSIAPDPMPSKNVVFRNSTGQVYVADTDFAETATPRLTYTINTAQDPYSSAQAKYTLTVSANDISIQRQP